MNTKSSKENHMARGIAKVLKRTVAIILVMSMFVHDYPEMNVYAASSSTQGIEFKKKHIQTAVAQQRSERPKRISFMQQL